MLNQYTPRFSLSLSAGGARGARGDVQLESQKGVQVCYQAGASVSIQDSSKDFYSLLMIVIISVSSPKRTALTSLRRFAPELDAILARSRGPSSRSGVTLPLRNQG